ncbi:MAG: small ribosomal subunit biogenesis GTPase RsgA [Alteromonadaceae bacterium]|nr:small ribosomal subunit biogenesis GTPase RsgA [Alteromonadaceae bacterium]
MAKKKLTHGQARRIKANQAKKLRNKSDQQHWQDNELSEAKSGVIISRFGQHADVESEQGEVFRCNLRRSIDSLVCGDKVLWRQGKVTEHSISGVIEAVEERSTMLCRPDVYDGIKPIAANIDQIFIVSSVLPAFNTDIIDRYLVAAEQTGITPIILLNKIDLFDQANEVGIMTSLNIYQSIGYQVFLVSNESAQGIEELRQLLNNNVSIFVGQSGVGKSTLVNSLMPELGLVTKQVSNNSGLGQHTTTVARLFHFSAGGDLIDSPGIREFGLWHLNANEVFNGFTEFAQFQGLCKFRDCKHQQDPGCALTAAVENKQIHPLRFASFQRILASLGTNKLTSRFND